MAKKLTHVTQVLTDEQSRRHTELREEVERDFPPVAPRTPSPAGIPASIRAARESQGLTWYVLAQLAGIPDQSTIRDIEQGNDVKLSDLQAVARALKLELELVPAGA